MSTAEVVVLEEKKPKKNSKEDEEEFDDEVSVTSEDSQKFAFSRSSSSSRLKHHVEHRHQQNIIRESRCGDYYPSEESHVFPLIDFFSSLVPRRRNYNEETNFITQSKLEMNIPHTVVFGVDDNPIMYFTDNRGRVVRVDNVSPQQVERKLTYGCDPEVFSVVQKKDKMGTIRSNNSQLLNAKQLKTILETQGKGKVLFQRFVDCKGPKACMTRFIWNKHKPTIAFMISNRKLKTDRNEKEKDKIMMTNCDNFGAVNVFKVSGKVIMELKENTKRIVKYLEKYWRGNNVEKRRKKLKFDSLVCDYIKDTSNKWWLLQIKGFKLIKPKFKLKRKCKKSYIKLKSCKMCLNYYSPRELIYRMSLKMIYATECHLKQRAEYLPWFGRPEFNSVTDTSMWYESHKVCKNCFDMYLQEQKLSKVEMEFAKAIGIPVQEKTTENASILENLNKVLTESSKSNAYQRIKKKYSPFGDENEIPDHLCMYRLITFISEIRNVPETVSDTFSLRTKIFEEEEVIKISNSSLGKRKNIKIGKLRVYYFFVKNEEMFREWITKKKNISINLVSHNGTVGGDEFFNKSSKKSSVSSLSLLSDGGGAGLSNLGVAKLELKQFSGGLIDKLDYMSLFSSKVLKLCSIRAIIGFVKMKRMDMSNIKVRRFEDIYIPNSDFFTADPLPSEWMEVIPGLSNELRLDKVAKLDKNLLARTKRTSRKKRKVRKISSRTITRRPMSARISRRKTNSIKKRNYKRKGIKKRPKSARGRKFEFNSMRRNSYSGLEMGKLDLDLKKTRFMRTYGRKYSPIYGSVFASIQKESNDRLSQRSRSSGRVLTRSNSSSSFGSNTSSFVGGSNNRYRKKRKVNKFRSSVPIAMRVTGRSVNRKKRKGKKFRKYSNTARKKMETKENNFFKFSKNEEKKKNEYKLTDNFYSFHIEIGSVKDLNSELDETWNLNYKVFYTQNELPLIKKEYESFQLQENAPLEFDIKDTFYILSDEEDLLNYFSKEKILRISLQKKYQPESDKHVSFIDLSKLIGKNSIVEYAPFEKVKDNESDLDLKFFNFNSNVGDDEEIEEEEDGDESPTLKDQSKNCLSKIKVFLKKIKKVSEVKNMEDVVIQKKINSYNIRLVKDVPN